MADDDPTLTDPPADPPQDPPADPPADPPPEPNDLGDKGKKALAEERAARRAAEKAAKEAREEAEKLRREQMDETQRAIAEARDEARRDALATTNRRLISAEVRAAAAKKGLADPADAVNLLDLDSFDVDDDGEVDASAIEAALDELVERKPYLKSESATPPPPGIDQGSRGGPPEPGDPAKETDPKKVVEWARKLRSSA